MGKLNLTVFFQSRVVRLRKAPSSSQQFFFLYIFMGFCVFVPLPPLRSQHTVLCHPRSLPTSGLTEFAVCWGGAGFEPRTTDLQSGALPLSHLSSWYFSTINNCWVRRLWQFSLTKDCRIEGGSSSLSDQGLMEGGRF
jgi:hypothetical protein